MKYILAVIVLFVSLNSAEAKFKNEVYIGKIDSLKIQLELLQDGRFALNSHIKGKYNWYTIVYSFGKYDFAKKDTLILRDLYHDFKLTCVKKGNSYILLNGFIFLKGLSLIKTDDIATEYASEERSGEDYEMKQIAKRAKQAGTAGEKLTVGRYSDCPFCKDSLEYAPDLFLKKNGEYEYFLNDYKVSYGTWKLRNSIVIFNDKVFKTAFYAKQYNDTLIKAMSLPITVGTYMKLVR